MQLELSLERFSCLRGPRRARHENFTVGGNLPAQEGQSHARDPFRASSVIPDCHHSICGAEQQRSPRFRGRNDHTFVTCDQRSRRMLGPTVRQLSVVLSAVITRLSTGARSVRALDDERRARAASDHQPHRPETPPRGLGAVSIGCQRRGHACSRLCAPRSRQNHSWNRFYLPVLGDL